MRNSLFGLTAGLILCGFSAQAAEPVRFALVPEQSSIAFEAQQNGNAITGEFATFTADIAFHPEALEKSKVTVTVNTGDVKADLADVSKTLAEASYFNPQAFPTAVFTTTGFKSLGENKYEASATFTIKDKALPATLLFTLDEFSEAGAAISGETTLSRTAFTVGPQETGSVADAVKVTVKLKTTAEK